MTAAAVATMLAGCTSSAPLDRRSATPDTAGPAVGRLSGEVARFGDRLRVAVDGAAVRVTVSKPRGVEPGGLGGPKRNRYAVRVTVVGRSGTFDVNPVDFSARDEAGDTFDPGLGGVDDQADPSSVSPGEKLRLRVAFEVPNGKRIAAVSLLTVLGDRLATWRAGH